MKDLNSCEYLQTSIGEIIVRPFEEKDINFQVAYLYDSPQEFLEQIGFDFKKLPGKENHRKRILENLMKDQQNATFRSVVAQFDAKTIAAVNLPLLELPDIPRGHFHIYDPMLRGKGLGLPILKTGLKILMNQHGLQQIFIEPKADNSAMNRLMQKAGFRYIGPTLYSSPTTTEFQANRYEVTLEILKGGLKNAHLNF